MSPDQTLLPQDAVCTIFLPVDLHVVSTDWLHELLEAFCLRMTSLGMCVSRSLMKHDPRYGLEQLFHAHNMADDTLRAIAEQLFQHVQISQPAISELH